MTNDVIEQHETSVPSPSKSKSEAPPLTPVAKNHWHHWKSFEVVMIHTFECTICHEKFVQETKSGGK